MKNSCRHTNPLKYQGTSQTERFLKSLNPENVELHGLDVEDWLHFARGYARLINYYPSKDAEIPEGDWQDFFSTKDEIKALLERYGDGDTEPHLALFISFLKLLDYSQQSLNRLPKRHLDFYYKEVLKLKKKSFTPDRVHLLFELAQNAQQELIEDNVLLKAGDDSEGNPLRYATMNSLVVNPAKVTSLKSVFVDEKGILRQAPVTNSADGQGADFEEDKTWPVFGYPTEKEKNIKDQWPKAELSFYIASHLLYLKEGIRTVTLDFTFNDPSKMAAISTNDIKAQFTGEKGWLDPVDVGVSDSRWIIELTSDKKPVTGYDEAIHQATLKTDQPVLKIRFTEESYYKSLKEIKIDKLELKVEVDQVKSLQLQNQLGTLDPTQPFMPFGASPKVGSKLSIAYPEMDGKPISHFEIGMRWMDLPANFSEHYSHYASAISDLINSYTIAEVLTQFNYSAIVYYGGFIEEVSDTMKDNFKVDITSSYQSDPKSFELFTNQPQIKVNVDDFLTGQVKVEIEMILISSFYHDLYPEIYLNAVLNPTVTDPEADNPEKKVDLPSEPYTPLLEELTLNYTASENISFADLVPDEHSSLMYHRHPFGTKRVMGANKTLLPKYDDGYFFIGLENMGSGSNISLLFQIAEGSENPLHSSFKEDEGPDWWFLSDNDWMSLKGHTIRNDTNNFLRSGIVEIAIPKAANSDNSLLESGLHWLRVRLKKAPDAVPRFIGIHAQANEAIFHNNGNTTDHYRLPAETINKLVHPRAALKSVTQPYASFGGEPAETDDAFYRRVSERLRHKNRAVSIWDYERMVLQQFPSLYKVKCMNYAYWNMESNALNELSPGDVTLVLIPKISEYSSAELRLKPQVSQNFKDEVEKYINRQKSMHADVKAVNPQYESVRFEFGVRFQKGLDFNFHKNKTRDDLKRLLAPWAFESGAEITFGGGFTEYEVVNYLENLEHVDYITDFRMYHLVNSGDQAKKAFVEPSNPLAILVPSDKHHIQDAGKCKGNGSDNT